MSEITVKLKDPTRIAWDQETGLVITGPDPVVVEETHFIRAKINEGILVEVQPEIKLEEPPVEPPAETPATNKKK